MLLFLMILYFVKIVPTFSSINLTENTHIRFKIKYMDQFEQPFKTNLEVILINESLYINGLELLSLFKSIKAKKFISLEKNIKGFLLKFNQITQFYFNKDMRILIDFQIKLGTLYIVRDDLNKYLYQFYIADEDKEFNAETDIVIGNLDRISIKNLTEIIQNFENLSAILVSNIQFLIPYN